MDKPLQVQERFSHIRGISKAECSQDVFPFKRYFYKRDKVGEGIILETDEGDPLGHWEGRKALLKSTKSNVDINNNFFQFIFISTLSDRHFPVSEQRLGYDTV